MLRSSPTARLVTGTFLALTLLRPLGPVPVGRRLAARFTACGGSSRGLRRWQDDPVFRAFFIALLADAPFSAFRWETPPITTASAVRPFEFVLLDSPDLASHPDPDAFAEHFRFRSAR